MIMSGIVGMRTSYCWSWERFTALGVGYMIMNNTVADLAEGYACSSTELLSSGLLCLQPV